MIDTCEYNFVFAVDPGTTKSALVVMHKEGGISDYAQESNDLLRKRLHAYKHPGAALVVESIESFGMPVGRTVFETCYEVGRLLELWHGDKYLMPRKEVKMELCNSNRAKDGAIRQRLIDIYGDGDRVLAIGTKKKPGPLYGISNDLWSATAIAYTFLQKVSRKEHYDFLRETEQK